MFSAPDLFVAAARSAAGCLRLVLLLCALMMLPRAIAQEPADTSETIYEKIEKFSKKNKVTRWIHSGIFVPPEEDKPPPAPAVPSRRVNPYAKYKGKVIRRIEVHVMDPFGYTVEDTVEGSLNGLQRLGNRLHRRTRPRVVRNLLMVRPFDRLDPLKITESERVLRTSPIVNDASIMVMTATKDSVDLLVRVLDRWTIDVGADGDLSSANVRVTERNLIGLGHELEQRARLRFDEPFLQLEGHHRIHNIGRSYVSSYAYYRISPEYDRVGIALNRPFYSPLTIWAGGLSVNKDVIRSPIAFEDGEPVLFQEISPFSVDTWAGRSFPLERDGPESGRVSRLVLATRLATTRYFSRPIAARDPYGVFRNNTLFLLGIGLSQRQYYKERFLFRFGLTEDVPEGLLIRFIGGMQKRETFVNMPYLGAEVARGRHYPGLGYLSIDLGYGTFFSPNGLHDATFRGGFTYFSDLVDLGRWHLRQFIRGQSVLGFAKPVFSRLNLNVEQMYGFESHVIRGTHRSTLSFETVAYAPWDLIGFRIAPVLLVGLGVLNDEHEAYLSGRVHSSFTLGILIRNERLLMNTFEVALSFYPFIPELDGSLWEHNAFTNFNTGVRDLDFTSPYLIGYH